MNTRSNEEPTSLRYLDFSRAVLFSLGIVLHAAWLCKGRSDILAGIHDFIHTFRMESFFLIAGFFSAMTLTKGPPEIFLRNRTKRLFIPLLFCGIALNTALHCALKHDWHDFSFLLTPSYWLSGEWLAHLWFIGTLFMYVVLLYVLHKLCPRIQSMFQTRHCNLMTLLLGVAIVRWVLMYAAGHIAAINSANLLIAHPFQVMEYVAFFLAGYVFFQRADILEKLINRMPLNVLSIVLFWSVSVAFEGTSLGRLILHLWRAIYSIQVCAVLFWFARLFVNKPNPLIATLSDASYTVYLVHWPLMAIIYSFLAPSHVPVGVLFGVLVISTSILSFEIHKAIISRSTVLSLLMNGRLPSRSLTERFWPIRSPDVFASRRAACDS